VVEAAGAGVYSVRTLSTAGATIGVDRFGSSTGIAGIVQVADSAEAPRLLVVEGDGKARFVPATASPHKIFESQVLLQGVTGFGDGRLAACGTGEDGPTVVYGDVTSLVRRNQQ